MIFNIALKDLKVIFRDRKALAIMLIMPAVIMLILGSALGPMFESTLAIDKFIIAVVDKDDSTNSQRFYQEFLRGQMGHMFETYIVNEDRANEMLKKEIVPSVIVIPEDFGLNISNNSPIQIEVRSRAGENFKTGIVKAVVEGYANGYSRYNAVSVALEEILKDKPDMIEKPFRGISNKDALMFDLQSKFENSFIDFNEDNQEENKLVTGMQYYCAGMLVMFVLFGAGMGVKHMAEERENRTLRRLMTTRTGKASVLTGKFLGLMLITLTQALILIVFTSLVYGVDWGNSVLGVLLVTVSCTFTASGLGMMIAAIARTMKAADGISQLVVQLFTVLGGGMIPIYMMPDGIKILSKVTVNWWAVNGYYDLMLGGSFIAVLPYCTVMVLMGIVYLGIGIVRFRI